MDDRLARLESELTDTRRLVRELEQRVGALEAGERPAEGTAGELLVAGPAVAAGLAGTAAVIPLLGRTLLVFGGAYLLRAVTDSGLLPQAGGVLAGLGYALLWLVLADRAAAAGHRLSASFHGAASVAIAFPILWETVTRFRLLPVAAATAAVGAVALAALAVAFRRRLAAVAWLAALGGATAALAMMRGGESAWVPAALLILLGVAVLWLAYARRWPALPWLSAAAADLGVVVLAAGTLAGRHAVPVGLVVGIQLALFLAYLGSAALRSLVQHRPLGAFEAAQAAVALVVGYGGAVRVSQAGGLSVGWLGAAGILLALAAYAAAFSPALRASRRQSFFFFTTLALVLVLVASRLVVPPGGMAPGWALLAVACAALSWRFARVTLNLHSAVYLAAAAVASGLLATGRSAFLASAAEDWSRPGSGQAAVLAAILACLALPVARISAQWGWAARLPGLLVILLAVWGGGGALISLLAPAVARGPAGGFDAGALAALRTVALAGAAVLLAWLARRERWREAGWLVTPLLVVCGAKLLLEDFPRGRPLTLFVALVAVGAALIAASRLARRSG